MPRVRYTNEAAMKMVNELRTALALGELHLYKEGLVFSDSTTTAQFTAVEADYSGYAAIAVAALLAAYIDPAGGASAQVATQQFQHNGGAVANMIAGAWYEDAAGVLRLAVEFDAPVPMAVATDAIPLDVIFNIRN